MKERTRISMAVYELFQNLRRNIYIVLMLMCCMVLFLYSITIYYGTDYNYITTNEILKNGTQRTGLLSLNVFDPNGEYKSAFYNKVSESGCVEAYGGFTKSDQMMTEVFAKYPESNLVKTEMQKGSITCFRTTPQADKIIHVDLLEGKTFSELEYEEDADITYYYLGYNYRDIPLGTIRDMTYSNGTRKIDIVAGVLDKGQRWLTCYPFVEMNFSNLSSYSSTDDAVVAVVKDAGAPVFFTYDSQHTFEEVRKQCNEISKEIGCEVNMSLLEDGFNMVRDEKKVIYKMIVECMFILTVSALSVLLCTIYIEFMQSKRRYGLYYAVGMSQADVEHILAWKRVIEIVIAAALSYIIVSVSCKWVFWVEGDVQSIINVVLTQYCLWRMGVIVIVLAIVYIVASVFMLRLYSPTELLKRKE